MACPCCVTDVCLCGDERTKNCTYTISLSVPEKGYSVSLPMSCSTTLSEVFGYGPVRQPSVVSIPTLDPGTQSLFIQFTSIGSSASVGGQVRAFMGDCPQALSEPLSFPYNISFASQECDMTADSGGLPGTGFHIIVELHNINSTLVGNRNRYHYLYRISVDPSTNAVTASVVWQGQTGVRAAICTPLYPPDPMLRCLPCYANPDAICGSNEGWVGSGHCPYDITTVTPTLTIACPP